MPQNRRWVWRICKGLIWAVHPLFCRLTIEGRENLPLEGGGVVACNHNYGPDFVILGISSTRELCFMAKAEIFEWNGLLSAILRAGGAFPVKRGKGDSAAIETAIELAEGGDLIAMFPEGTRSKSGQLMRGKTGAARIAMAANVPIIPATVTNSALLFKKEYWRPAVNVRFGKPVYWHEIAHRNGNEESSASEIEAEEAHLYTEAVMSEIANLLPVELRGEYADVPMDMRK